MSVNPYDLSNIEELLQFEQDCLDAINECPQSKDVSIIHGYSNPSPVSVADVFRHYFKSLTLWSFMYHENLTERAKVTFRRYALLRNGDVYDIVSQKLLRATDRHRVDFKPEWRK